MADEGTVYFRDGKLVAEHGKARVYKMRNELFLEIGSGHTLWALESELDDYMEQLCDYPNGNCLEIGLGLGVASRYLQTFPRVKHVTTIELESDVIAVHEKIAESDRGRSLAYDPSKHLILNANGVAYAYQTDEMYDFIFIDCYDRIDEDTLPLIADMVTACSRILKQGGRMLGWIDKYTPEQHYTTFQRLLEI